MKQSWPIIQVYRAALLHKDIQRPELLLFYGSTISLGPHYVPIQFSQRERAQEGGTTTLQKPWLKGDAPFCSQSIGDNLVMCAHLTAEEAG